MTGDRGRPEHVDTRDIVRERAAKMSPGIKADFVNVPSHAATAIDTTIHVVAEGDTLATIATLFYGNANAGTLIFDANRDQLTDPDRIKPGQMLKIPPSPEP
jgi:nucleoid-associated protein YgaU